MDRSQRIQRCLITVISLVPLLSGCGSSGGGTVMNEGVSSGTNLNGPLTGEIWTTETNGIGSRRFNLQTGQEVQVGSGRVYPSRDGQMFVDYIQDVGFLEPPPGACLINVSTPLDQVDIRNSQTGALVSSFRTIYEIGSAIRLSPDGSKILALASPREECSILARSSRTALTVFSADDGAVIFRGTEGSASAFDWMPDGRIVTIQESFFDNNIYDIDIEGFAGSYDFQQLQRINTLDSSLNNSDEFVRRMRTSSDGSKFLIEMVTDSNNSLSTVFSRDSYVIILDTIPIPNTLGFVFRSNEFNNGGLRANEALLSPDDNWILTTHAFSRGVVVLSDTIDANIIGDSTVIVAPPRGSSYVVPVNTIDQLLPPDQVSQSIRPVIARRNGQTVAIGFNPQTDLSWTPPVQ